MDMAIVCSVVVVIYKRFRYNRNRKNHLVLCGKSDMVLTCRKIAIFVDGDFWHARGYLDNTGAAINNESWQKELVRNVE